jgi:cytoskeleton protein RodZ
MSIGQQLRQAREAQSLSLDQASQTTRIRLHYLEALEADQFTLLPSSAQLRGFLRAYADYLQLNSSQLIEQLEQNSAGKPAISQSLPPVKGNSDSLLGSNDIFKEIGQKLQSQRELMGLSLDDVERHTHIRVHYIKALEEGDISHLPSPVQGRGMLSNYAAFLGLDAEEILLRFADGLQASLYDRQATRNGVTAKTRHNEASQIPARPSQFKRLFSMDLFVGGFLIIFLLGFTVWGAMRISKINSSNAPSPTAPNVSEILMATQLIPSGSPTLTVSEQPVISATLTIPTTLLPGTEVVELTQTPNAIGPIPGLENAPIQVYVVAHQRAWFRIIVDGNIAFENRVLPGSAYTFSGNERIDLLTGNAAGIQVYFNQQDLGILGGFGEIVERVFTIHGVQTPTPAIPLTSTPVPSGTPTSSATATQTGSPIKPSATPTPTPAP